MRHVELVLSPPARPPSRAEAFHFAAELARRHYENFSLASLLVPRGLRKHIFALYAFLRTTDDLGDEAPGDRLSLLDSWEAELEAAYRGEARHPVMVALSETIRSFDLPLELLRKVIEANRMDQRIRRYRTFAELLRYCDHSANPVGRLYLMLFGYRDEELFRLSDKTCTALQLTNFWQDISRDLDRGRIYLPLEDMERFGYSEVELLSRTVNAAFRELMAFEVERARSFFAEGLALPDRLRGFLRVEVRLFSYGGLAILRKIEALDYDTLHHRPTLSRAEKFLLFLRTILRHAPRIRPA
ncbi:MAG TPA: squalene synthase HpnC [Candidatus Acetothermia bacterium]|nr:squalene synthase HpnC [Candidatus Acetothermia bacterium]